MSIKLKTICACEQNKHCPFGGVKITTPDSKEVDICNGAPGVPGVSVISTIPANGANNLLLPPKQNCSRIVQGQFSFSSTGSPIILHGTGINVITALDGFPLVTLTNPL